MNRDGNPPSDFDSPTLPGIPDATAAAAQTPPPQSRTPAPSVPSESWEAPTLLDGMAAAATSNPSASQASQQIFYPNQILAGRYKILRMLGEGGMGAVYQARDQELDRLIALKVIRPELASNPSILQRFKQELILARHVTHKNVIRIFDLGEAGGTKFITMEYVEGEDLRALLRRDGKLPPDTAVDIIQQICRALDAAHAEGVIHRDLKPQNVLRDPNGRVVVMDFGLARSLAAPGMTQTGALVGTLEYMSPEQAMGAELDQRSDVFAVGLIFYELLTGKVPYKAETAVASLMKRTQERAVPASEIDAAVPKALSAIVSRCLERDPKQRCQSAHELLQQLDLWRGNPNVSSAAISRLSSAAPRSVQISLALPGNRIWMWVAAAVLIGLVSIPVVRHYTSHPAVETDFVGSIPDLSHGKYLAVLPFKVIGDEKSLRYIADGLVDALSAKMFQLQEVHVASSSAVEKASATNQPLAKTARTLGVNLVLQGMVQGSADKLRVTLELEDVPGGRRLWAREFSGVPQDLLALEDQMYGGMVSALALNPSGEERARSGIHPTENTSAYDLYLKGRDALRGNQGTRDTQSAIRFFEGASQQDPNFSLAYTGLADANLRLYKDTKDVLYAEKALVAAQKAEGLNPALPEVHLSLGSVYNNTGRSVEAVAELKRALALAPNSDEAYRRLGDVYRATGRKQDAISAYQSAVTANPYYWSNHNALGGAYLQFGENERALEEWKRVTELAPDNATGYQNIGALQIRLGQWNDAIPSLQKALRLEPTSDTYSNLGTAYFFLKRNDEAIRMFEKAVEVN
ncbi:MAG: protein kinase, partial [Acidobacteriales bacterium]|nr:protein kinase [Terriglobales bacterium]